MAKKSKKTASKNKSNEMWIGVKRAENGVITTFDIEGRTSKTVLHPAAKFNPDNIVKVLTSAFGSTKGSPAKKTSAKRRTTKTKICEVGNAPLANL